MGHFRAWDSKITTFPGMYYVSAVMHGLIESIVSGGSRVFDDSTRCSSSFLRRVNVILGWLCAYVIHGIVSHVESSRTKMHRKDIQTTAETGDPSRTRLRVVLCSTFPLHAFFIFLYYTDTASTLCILSAWLALLKKRYYISGIISALSILMRQTNAVWTAYLVGWELFGMAMEKHRVMAGTSSAASELIVFARFVLHDILVYIQKLWIHILSIVAFALFVVRHGGIVLGDKEHHVPVTHLMQPFYFYTFLVISTAPLWIQYMLNTRFVCQKANVVGIVLAGWLAFIAVKKGTLVHPFILADNRHYTFYLWRRLLDATPCSRYYLVPIYAVTTWLCIGSAGSRPKTKSIMLAGSTALVLIPAHLVEFRYFTIPWFFYMLDEHSVLYQRNNSISMVCTLVGYALLNTITMYVFLYRSFSWPDGSVARFMW